MSKARGFFLIPEWREEHEKPLGKEEAGYVCTRWDLSIKTEGGGGGAA